MFNQCYVLCFLPTQIARTAKETFTAKKKETLEEISVDEEDGKAKKAKQTGDEPKAQKGEADGKILCYVFFHFVWSFVLETKGQVKILHFVFVLWQLVFVPLCSVAQLMLMV